jgi:hypothetical protein
VFRFASLGATIREKLKACEAGVLTRRLAKPGAVLTSEGVSLSVLTSGARRSRAQRADKLPTGSVLTS